MKGGCLAATIIILSICKLKVRFWQLTTNFLNARAKGRGHGVVVPQRESMIVIQKLTLDTETAKNLWPNA